MLNILYYHIFLFYIPILYILNFNFKCVYFFRYLQEYLQQPLFPPSSNPLIWWKTNAEKFSSLVPVALKYLSIPGTSVCSERMFSKAGEMVTARRQRLSPHSVEKLVFLHDNI